ILNNQLGYPSEAEVLKENLSKVLSLPDNYLLVVEYEQKIIAWLNVRLVTTIESGTNSEIYGLIVDEAYRNKGIGKELICSTKEWARQHGIKKLRVRTNVKRLEAHRFYFREGFKEMKEQKSLEVIL
ncbi:MAG: GNAT family N-acetyltransferase, partial [Sphingobacteriales bacterium]|nr:GNAT family N-acetyltransferase [Sphingobacteriales bacterium]